jgi:predicted RNase H-like nuclease (RuvC/YqgF family)
MTNAQDRTYWRQSSNKTLIEQARYSDNELAIALGERLEESEHDEDTIRDLLADNKHLMSENAALEREIARLRGELEQMRFASKF